MADPDSDIDGISLFQKQVRKVRHGGLSDKKMKNKTSKTIFDQSKAGDSKKEVKKKKKQGYLDQELDITIEDLDAKKRKKKKKSKDIASAAIGVSHSVNKKESDPSDISLGRSAEIPGNGNFGKKNTKYTDVSNTFSDVRHEFKGKKRKPVSEEEDSCNVPKIKDGASKGKKRKGGSTKSSGSSKKKRRGSSKEDSDLSDSGDEDRGQKHSFTPEDPGRSTLARDDSDSGQDTSEDREQGPEDLGKWTSPQDDSDSGQDTSEEEKEEEKAEMDEYALIKQELSNMSFEDIQKIQEKLGMKVFNQIRHGGKMEERKKQRLFKRENKNRPMEISSKRPVRIVRDTGIAKKKTSRDPRFDDLSGEYNETYFKKSYAFLDDVKVREKEKVQKTLSKEKDPNKKKDLQYLLNRMNQQETSSRQKDRQDAMDREVRQKEKDMVKEGKTPYFLKKADKKKLELAEKFKELKKSGKVEKYLVKKRKKNAQKDRKKLPPKFDRFDI